VAYRHDRFAKKPDESGTINKKYTMEEFKKNNQLTIDIDQNKKHYITVYTYDENDKLYSSGMETLENCGDQDVVKYFVDIKKSFFLRKVEEVFLVLASETENLVLQNIVLVFKVGAVPITKDDGEMIKNMKKVSFNEGNAKISIPQRYWGQRGYVKLFFKNNDDGKHVRLMPAAEEKLQIK
jgi:putative transposon-encoded protein